MSQKVHRPGTFQPNSNLSFSLHGVSRQKFLGLCTDSAGRCRLLWTSSREKKTCHLASMASGSLRPEGSHASVYPTMRTSYRDA